MGVVGAAVATVTSQVYQCNTCNNSSSRRNDALRLYRKLHINPPPS